MESKETQVKKTNKEPQTALATNFEEINQIKTTHKDDMDFIRDTLAPSLNDKELLLFLFRCQKVGLNPLNGEAFAYSSHDTVGGKQVRKMVMIVARDGKRKIALRTGKLKSIRSDAVYVATDEYGSRSVEPWDGGKLWGALCTIERAGFEKAFQVAVPLSEYTRNTAIWRNKPDTMIKKVAESQCLSMAFPELAGYYDESERFDNGNGATAPQLEDGGKSATAAQLKTIETLGGKISRENSLTKQEAADMISELAKKGKKK